MEEIVVYTDGSCHTQLLVGAWAAIIFKGSDRIVLSGVAHHTTHNRMELQSVIEALKYSADKYSGLTVHIYTDSQYVVGLEGRREKLTKVAYKTNAGNEIQNVDLVKQLWSLQDQLSVKFTKVEAHLKKTELVNHNIEVDTIVRALLRSAIANG
ncbi:hypothetical protein CJD36_018820 [Flavipsychrobacter stenotrophus]|uniref:RNase H type-1 domain-containing protein n=1 Tax=Flavipsychrobacter stenotrophus TaxID=2077091 RepID=A0A2S7SQX8_9BACT|nr:RNase H family protein [Flavipsychrobacter stenotrophus]PQJ09303.1 hypothetical protein CJD36_018820 [Flavipsychrobacter stenotrophus]